MRRKTWLAVAGIGLVALSAGLVDRVPARAGEGPTAAEKKAANEDINKLIPQLAAKDAKEREAAAKRLIDIGEPALAALRRAVKRGDAKAPQRIRQVIGEIGKRLRGHTDPPRITLELKLAAKKKTYPLDLGDKTEKELRDLVKELSAELAKKPLAFRELAAKFPAAPKVDLKVELRNTGKKAVHFMFGRRVIQYRDPRVTDEALVFGRNLLLLELRGPGALSFSDAKTQGTFRDAEGYRGIALAPGKSFALSLKQLHAGPWAVYWTRPGEYWLRAVFTPAIGELQGQPLQVKVYSNWVKFQVVAKK
jgi:hypothetical protein